MKEQWKFACAILKTVTAAKQPYRQRQRETDIWMAGCNIHPFTTKLLVVSGRNK
jgi:hypothetical protein